MGTHTQTSNNVEKTTIPDFQTLHWSSRRWLYQWWGYRQVSRDLYWKLATPYAKTNHTAYQTTGTCTTAATIYPKQATSPGDRADSSRTSATSGEYCTHWKLKQKTNQCHWMMSTLTKIYSSWVTPWIGWKNLHQTDTCVFTIDIRTDVNISYCHPVQMPWCHMKQMTTHQLSCLYRT